MSDLVTGPIIADAHLSAALFYQMLARRYKSACGMWAVNTIVTCTNLARGHLEEAAKGNLIAVMRCQKLMLIVRECVTSVYNPDDVEDFMIEVLAVFRSVDLFKSKNRRTTPLHEMQLIHEACKWMGDDAKFIPRQKPGT